MRPVDLSAALVLSSALVPFVPTAAAAALAGPGVSLVLAALVGAHDPAFAPATATALRNFADGRGGDAHGRPILVAAKAVTCRESDVDIAARACTLAFGTRDVEVGGLAAYAVAAALREAGAQPQGAAGTIITAVGQLRCTVTPAAVLDKAGGGAACTFAPPP